MCHMITVLLSPGKHKDKFKTVLKEHKRNVSNANDGQVRENVGNRHSGLS